MKVKVRYETTDTLNNFKVNPDTRLYEVWTQESTRKRWWLRGWIKGGSKHEDRADHQVWQMLPLEAVKTTTGGGWGEVCNSRDKAVERTLGVVITNPRGQQ